MGLFALGAIDMSLVRSVFNLTQGPVPVRRIARELLDQGAHLEFDCRVANFGVLELAHDACDIHAQHGRRNFFGADEILLVTDAQNLEFLTELFGLGFQFFV